MRVNTALGFVLAGAALGLALTEPAARPVRRLGQLCASTVAALGLLTLGEHLFGWDLGIDQIVWRGTTGTAGTLTPGRMSPQTSLNFATLGLALLLLDSETRHGRRPCEFLTLTAALVSFLGLLGYAYGVQALYGVVSYNQMAVHTALAFLVLCAGVLLARPHGGLMAIVTSKGTDGVMVRRLLPAAVGIPPVLGWLRLQGQYVGLYNTEFGVSLIVACTIVILGALIMGTARALRRMDRDRSRAKVLEEQYRRVQAANRLKSEFLANMSHELRTPLNAIIGFAELMHDGKVGPVSAQHKEFLGDILTSSRHLLQLINDVLDLAKVEAGKMEFRPEPVDLARVVTEVQDVLRTLMAKKRIHVQSEIDLTLTHIVTDPGKLKQVLYNYLSNALKFTPDEGRVTVRVMPEGSEAFRLEVEDTGIGIRREDQGRLFVEFQQLDASTAKKHPGTGLGLALTKRIVEAQGGRVGVRSTPGEGSVFFAILPRVALATPEAEATPAVPRVSRPGAPAILIIEDDARDRAWLQRTLSEAGYAAEVAATGAEGLALCRERPFEAITLDLLLPDMNGWEVLEVIRTNGPNRDVPVIVVTVVAEGAGVRSFPVHEFLAKPVQTETLLASLVRAGIAPDGSKKILVVDDDPHALKLAETILTQLGYQPICKADAERGLRAAAEEKPAAVVLDLLMPGMDGFAFLERFRRTATGRWTPVIVWTVKDLSADERKRLKTTAQAVVQKGQGGTAALLEQLKASLSAPRE
jgi:signal transduction histidine kinase/CheY-like chemotaxis protein